MASSQAATRAAATAVRSIYCDLDGVLCDFTSGVFSLLGQPPEAFTYTPHLMWPRLAACKDPPFYERLEWTSDGRELWSFLMEEMGVGEANGRIQIGIEPPLPTTPPTVSILTGLPRGGWAEEQKRTWCRKNLGEKQVDVVCCWSKFKHVRAAPGVVLIDDRGDLREAWEGRGGIFIHHRTAAATIAQLKALLPQPLVDSQPPPPPPPLSVGKRPLPPPSASADDNDDDDDGDTKMQAGGGSVKRSRPTVAVPPYCHPHGRPSSSGGNWRNVLREHLDNPASQNPATVYFENDNLVVIYDGFPKAEKHLLLLPKPSFLPGVRGVCDLRPEHLNAVQRLHKRGRWIAKGLGGGFRIGYHAIPSLEPLHLHIISTDFDSPALKNKKHWNSFTTSFFIDWDFVEQQLAEGVVVADVHDRDRFERLLKADMQCPRCLQTLHNIPTAKQHVANGGCRR